MNSKTLQNLTDANASLKVMASPQKMQQYMDRHRIGPLFEVYLIILCSIVSRLFDTQKTVQTCMNVFYYTLPEFPLES